MNISFSHCRRLRLLLLLFFFFWLILFLRQSHETQAALK